MKTGYTAMLSGAAFALLVGGAGTAQAGSGKDADATGFSIEGSVRARAEVVEGQVRPNAPDSDAMLSFRTLITASYDFGGVHITGEIDDARSYFQHGQSTAGTSESNALEPLQAYLGIDLGTVADQKGKGVLRLGRFTASSGSGRLLDRPDWSNSPNSFLGANLDWSSKRGDRLQLIAVRPFDKLPSDRASIEDNQVELDRANAGVHFWGGSFTRAKALAGANAEVFAYGLDERDRAGRATRNRDLFTFGGRVNRAAGKGKLDFELEGALQRGTTRGSTSASDVLDRKVRAGMANVEIGYTFASGWTPRVTAFVGYASGDTSATDYRRFDPLFGGRRGDYGPLSLYGPASWSNIVSPGIALEAKPSKAWDFSVKARKFMLASATDSFAATSVRDASGASGRDAGTQIEGRVRNWLVPKRLRVEAGAAWLAKGRFLTDAPNAPATGDMRFGYLTLSTFF
ncbi:alginate export family protein [Sphingomonas sp. R647]|uniref:alginate export family protein n=1 Tax=Sphingomonas sp. R647 TaxID=2875233 RepID=UPI001CD31167|nr:alginate export family protein [Sphingomonas sp. R647]MCA1199209.1 alginate export family protein [Sphingomonas sp. R647]